MALNKIGGYVYHTELTETELVLRFKKADLGEHSLLDLLELGIANAFRDQADKPARLAREERERSGAGIDPAVLRKVRNEVDKVLSRFDNRELAKAQQLADAVKSFAVGETVTVKADVKDIGGKAAIVKARRKTVLVIEVEGKRWKAPPRLLEKAHDGRVGA